MEPVVQSAKQFEDTNG